MAARSRSLRILFPLVGLAVLVVLGSRISPTASVGLVGWSERHWTIVALGLVGLYLVRPFFLWPLSVFSVFIGYLVGFPIGVPLALAGTLITCFPPFLLADYVRESDTYVGWIAERVETLFEASGETRGVIAARFSPAPADAVSYGAGIAGVSSRSFAVGTLVGELPWATFYVLLGQSIGTFSSDSIRHVNLQLFLLSGSVALLLVARPLYEVVSNGD